MERKSRNVSGSTKRKQKTRSKFTVKGKEPTKLLEQAEWHVVEFIECQENPGKGEYGDYLIFVFEVTKGTLEDGETDAKGVQCRYVSGADVRVNNTAWWIITRLLGTDEFEEDDDIDISSCIGEKYRIMVEHKAKKGDPDTIYNDIKMLKKYVPKKKKTTSSSRSKSRRRR
jgi:hypothetical protein